jgi:stearoyl-CoA desaturase (delta-9 desaturase)
VDRFQIDITAEMIKLFECVGWAKNARWPSPSRLADRRRGRDGLREDPILEPAGL